MKKQVTTLFVCLIVATTLLGLSVPSVGAQTLLALVDTGELFASPDGGITWGIRSTLPISDAAGLVAGSTSSELFLVSESGVMYRSPNAGLNWTAMGSIAASDVIDLAGRPDGGLIALTRTGTAWLSMDEGATFSALGTLTASNHVSLVKGADENIYALTETGEVAKSTNDGVDWVVVGTIPVSDAVSIRRIDTDLFILCGAGITYQSTDSGVTWTAVGTVSQVGMSGLVQYIGDLVAVNTSGLVARSADGSSWSWVGAINQLNVIAVANDIPQAIGVPDTPISPGFTLAPPSPNPMVLGGQLHLAFRLPEQDKVVVSLYDSNGRQVGGSVEHVYPEGGDYTFSYAPGDLPAGVYYLEMRTSKGYQASHSVHILR